MRTELEKNINDAFRILIEYTEFTLIMFGHCPLSIELLLDDVSRTDTSAVIRFTSNFWHNLIGGSS